MHPPLDAALTSLVASRGAETIVVVGCGGGAGASTLVAGLARAAVRGARRVAVLDLDRCGGGLDVVFGIERQEGVRWAQVSGSQGELDGPALRDALPCRDEAVVLSYGREATAVPDHVVEAAIEAMASVCDVLLVDAPRGVDLHLFPPQATVIVVADGSVRGGAACGSVLQTLRTAGREPVVVLRDASGQFADELSEAVSVQVVAHLASERRVEHDLSHGDQPGSRGELAKVCTRLVTLLLERRMLRAA